MKTARRRSIHLPALHVKCWKRWPEYEQAVCDMIERTSTDMAPWNLIAANDKLHARVQVLERLVQAIKRA